MKDLRDTQEETNALLEALLQVVPRLSLQHPPSDEEVTTTKSSSKGLQAPDYSSRTSLTPTFSEKMPRQIPVVVPTSTITNSNACWSDCACSCHRRQNFKTPTILSNIAGNLMLGYNGSMVLKQRCTVASCRKCSDKSPQISYYFPSWFVQRAITLSLTKTAFGTPTLNLKVRRVVSEMSELFRLSRFGDVAGVQALFSAQEASPDDVNPIGGWTALHVSKLLVQ